MSEPAAAGPETQQQQQSTEEEQQQEMMSARRSVLMRFTFVRHGETQANKDRCIQGHTDIPLCESGEEQAIKVGERLRDVRFTRVYTSDLCRAATTCRLILSQNACHLPTIVTDTRLRERNFGSVEGLVIEEVLRMAEASGSSWPLYSPPGAETLGDLQARLVAFFKEVCQSVYDKNNNRINTANKTKVPQDPQKAPQGMVGREEPLRETPPNGTQTPVERETEVEEENLWNEAKEREEMKKKEEAGKAGRKEGQQKERVTKEGIEEEEVEEEREHLLVVSHGAALRQLYTHFHRTLGCPLPPNMGPDTATRLTPNTAISQYSVRYSPKSYKLKCVCIHNTQHLQGL